MRNGRSKTPDRGLTRSLVRKGTRADRRPTVATKGPLLPDPSLCTRCGAFYSRKVWRWVEDPSDSRLARAQRTICPACAQAKAGVGFGTVRLEGAFVAASESALRARIANVADRASFTQPERRVVSIRRQGSGLEVRTTSQKLAHRIARELRKAFGGKARFQWSDEDGALLAFWRRDDVPTPKPPPRRRTR